MTSDFKLLKVKIANRERDRKLKEEEKQHKAELRYKQLLKKHDDIDYKTSRQRMQEREDVFEYDYKNTPLEAKQKFLDIFNSGKNLGEAAHEAGISTDIAAQVIVRNLVGMYPTKAKV